MLRLFEHGKLFVPQSEVGSACIVELAVRTGFRHFPLSITTMLSAHLTVVSGGR